MLLQNRGEIWQVDLSPTRGHEQGGRRPGLVLSVDLFNHSPAGLVVLLPLTTRRKGIPFHIEIPPGQAGLKKKSFIKCEEIRTVSNERLTRKYGTVSPETMGAVEQRVRILLDL